MGEPIAEVGYLAGLCGYIGTAWQKNSLIWGFSEIWEEDLGGDAMGATYEKASAPVPEGEVWVLQCVACRNRTRDPTDIILYVDRADGSRVALVYQAAPGLNVPVIRTGTFALGKGATVEVYLSGCQVDDLIEAGLIGYKMKLNL